MGWDYSHSLQKEVQRLFDAGEEAGAGLHRQESYIQAGVDLDPLQSQCGHASTHTKTINQLKHRGNCCV